jgi:hypothetical protein
MTVEEMESLFDRFEDEFLKFDRVATEDRLKTARPDLCAFLWLDKLVPENSDIIQAAEHDQIWMGCTLDDLAAVVTEPIIRILVRCGVRIEDGILSMYA